MGARRNCFNDPRRRNPPRSPGVIASPFQDQQHHEQLQLPLPSPSPSEVYYHGQVNGLSLQRPLPQWPNPAPNVLMTEPVDLVGQIVADIFSERQIEERMIDRDGDVDAAGLGEAADDMYLEAKAKLLFYCNTIGVDLDAITLPSELRQSLSQRLRQAEEHEAEVAHGQPATVPSPQPEPEPEPEPEPNPEPRRQQPIPPAFLLTVPSKPLPVSDVSHAKQQHQQQQKPQQQRQPAPTTTTKSGGTGKTTSGQTTTTTTTTNKSKADPNKGMARGKTSAGGMIQNSTRPQRSGPPPASKPPAPAPRAPARASAPAPPPPTPILARVPAPATAPTPKTTTPKPAETATTTTTTTLDADGDSEMGDASDSPFPAATIARALSPHLPPPVMIDLDNDVHMSNSSATTHPFLPHLGLDPREAVNAALMMVRNCGDWCAWLRAELELALEQVLRQRQRASYYY